MVSRQPCLNTSSGWFIIWVDPCVPDGVHCIKVSLDIFHPDLRCQKFGFVCPCLGQKLIDFQKCGFCLLCDVYLGVVDIANLSGEIDYSVVLNDFGRPCLFSAYSLDFV